MPRVTLGDRTIELAAGETVLDGLLRNRIHVPYSCRSGGCQTCVMQALEGAPTLASQESLPAAEQARKLFLACCCIPTGDLVVKPLYGE